MREYTEGYKLLDNEYLRKIRTESDGHRNGFLTKLTQKGAVPVGFTDWCGYDNKLHTSVVLPIFIVEETFKSGWYLLNWRFGMSQNWAKLVHPDGYAIEIYLQQFLEIVKNNTIKNGEIIGEFKWEDKKLIKK